jgi:rubrerythrin
VHGEEENMSMNKTNILGILANAIEMEYEGKAFFEDVASKSRHQRTKDTFMSLVKQEQRHVDILSEELRRINKGMPLGSLEELKRTAPQSPRISVFKDSDVKRFKFDPDAGELDALKLGIEIEKKSIEYYRTAGAQSADRKARELFSWLVGEEGGHLTILSAEHEYRNRSGFYYDNMEFSLEVM